MGGEALQSKLAGSPERGSVLPGCSRRNLALTRDAPALSSYPTQVRWTPTTDRAAATRLLRLLFGPAPAERPAPAAAERRVAS